MRAEGPPKALPQPVQAQAAAAFQAGLEAFQSGDFETAKNKYEEAYKLAPHPSTLYNLAQSCERLLDYDAAIFAFKRFLDEPLPGDAEAARLQETRRLLAERSLKRLKNLPARVSLSAVPDPVTATVAPLTTAEAAATDSRRCDTPCIVTVPAGSYRLTMQREGYFPEAVDFDAHVGQALLISRQLRPRPRRVLFESQPRGRLYLDDRLLGETPFVGDIPLGNHRLRVERRFYLTHTVPFDIGPGSSRAPFRLPMRLELSGRVDMIIGGAVAGAGLGLMVLRLFLGQEIETLGSQDVYKPLAAATLPAALGAVVAGFAGWEMPVSEAQLLIGSAGWGTVIGFGLGLGAQPQGPLPHVLAIGGGLLGGTLGTAVYRFVQPRSGTVALYNSTALWSSLIGSLGWAYLISDHPETAFYGQSSTGRNGDGGWVMLGAALGGVGLGIGLSAGLSRLPALRDLSRSQVSLVDLGGFTGGLVFGALGMGIGYARTNSWTETAHIAVPCTIAGIGAGIVTSAILTSLYRNRLREREARLFGSSLPIKSGTPQLNVGRDLYGGITLGVGILDGRF